MSFEDTIVQVSITATSATPSVPNSTTPAIYAYHTHNTDLVRTYTDLSGMVSDGFSTTEPAYLMASRIVAQNPRPPEFKVIRATDSAQQLMTFTVTDVNKNDTDGLVLTDPSGVTHAVQAVVLSGATVTSVATSLAGLTITGATLSSTGAVVTISINTTGAVWFPSDIAGGTFQDTTPITTTTPATDLAAAILVDNDWYGLSIEREAPAYISNVGDWVESNKKIFAYHTTDDDARASGGGIFNTMKTATYKRSYGEWTGTPIDFPALGLMAKALTQNPGTWSWALKEIDGAAYDILTSTQTTNIANKNGNFYISTANTPITFEGKSAQGQYMDLTQFLDALSSDIQFRIFNMLVNNPKVPMTQPGIAQVANQVRSSLASFVQSGALSNDNGFEPQVSFPNIGDVSPSDKQTRTLRGITFTAYYSGGIHKVIIQGVVNV